MKSGAPSAVTNSSVFTYGVLAFPLAFAGIPIYLHAPDFYADEFGASLATLGATLLLLRIVDAVQDPLIGRYSDRFNERRLAIIFIGVCLLATGFWMIFHPLTSMLVLWFAISVFVCTTGFSIVSINFQALGGLWHADKDERTKITSWREGIGLVGLLAAAIAPTLLGITEDAKATFHGLSIIYIPILAASAWLFFRWAANAEFDAPFDKNRPNGWLSIFDSRWRKHFFGIYFLNSLGSAIPAVMVIFFVRDRLQAETELGIFLLLYFLSGALFMPLWQHLSRVVGKYRCWMFSILLAVVSFCTVFMLGPGDREVYALICILSGAALGADLALPPSLLADHIVSESDQAVASGYFSIMTFLSKTALALATGITLPVLGALGYHPGNPTSPEVAQYLSISYGVVPSMIKLAVLFWIWRQLPLLQSVEQAKMEHENVAHQ